MAAKDRPKPVTMGDIARLAEVSKPTVSRVLRGSPLVSPATRAKVMEVVEAEGYAVNRNAQKLRHAKTDTVAVVLDLPSHEHQRIADPFIYDLLAGVSEALSMKNQELLLSPPTLTDAESYRKMLVAKGADGFIMLGQGLRRDLYRDLGRLEIPVVVWGAIDPKIPFCTVGSDNHRGGTLAGRHFIRHRRRRVLFVGDDRHREIAQRRDGLKAALKKAPYRLTLECVNPGGFSFEASHRTGARYLRDHPPPDAVFAHSDTAAMALIRAFKEAGLDCPEQLSVVGYNGIPSSAHFFPPITTIMQDTYLAGSMLVEKLFELIDGKEPRSEMLPTDIVVRAT